MALRRRSKALTKAEAEGCGYLVLLAACLVLALPVISFAIAFPLWLALAGVIAAAAAYRNHYYKVIWPKKYFASSEFLKQKRKIAKYVAECNELNNHIIELKEFQESIKSENKYSDIGTLRDTSRFNMKRQAWAGRLAGTKVHSCSKTIVTNAQNDPFKYLCKYFDIKPSEDSLADFEGMLNDLSAAEDGADCLTHQREALLRSIKYNIHWRAKKFFAARLERELGFDEFIFDELSFPTYSFQYVSAGGNSSMSYDIELDIDNTEAFVEYLSERVKFRKSVAGQRALMTKALREWIKDRDHHVCQMCGIDGKTTPNLLLEIDHIHPLAKGGITSEDNLQTLCWKCNRSKGSKVADELPPLPPPPP